jgi:hypothetical protein
MGSLASLRDQADEEPKSGSSRKAAASMAPNMYCLSNTHGPRLVTEERFFYWDPKDNSCPVCPICQKQVNAQALPYNAKGQPQIPEGVLALAHRIGEPV